MSSAGQAKVEVFDLRGRLVNTLVDERREVGEHIIDWEAKDFRGRTVSSGVYLLRATLGGKVHRQRLSLIR
jgi:flagellar hook assembly protein FlgD